MPVLYLTPASISFLAQFILSLAITVFLALRLRSRSTQLVLLTCFFAGATTFIGLMFLDAALLPYPRLLWAVYAENTVLALMLVFLLQFAYRFPRQYPQHKWEARAGLVVSLAYFLWEAGFMIYRYVSLLGHDTVYFRPIFPIYMMGLVLALPPIAFLRQCVAADARPVSWLRKLWKPKGKGARGARAFVGVFGILFLLGLANVALTVGLPNAVYNTILSIGILVSLWLFASNYINFVPGGAGMQTKLSVLVLTLFLALLGSVGWFIAPSYIKTFQPNLTDHQTLRFTPDEAGGYDVDKVAFAFEPELGERLAIPHGYEAGNYEIDFPFPFYGQGYDEMYVSGFGTLTLGQPFWEPNMQTCCASFPAIFPLMIDLDPDPAAGQGGIYARLDADEERLIVTWDHLPAFARPDAVFTFQVQLYRDGVFEITYNGLPLPFVFDPDASPRDNPWLQGIVAGRGEPLHTVDTDLLTTAQTGGQPLLENYYLAFRHYLHHFMEPLAAIVIGGSLLLSVVLPLLMRLSIITPLEGLTAGVRRLEAGDLSIALPIQHEDEIGYLTGAFNTMAARLGDLIHNLEVRVAERTQALHRINDEMALQLQEIQARNEELDAFARTVAHDIKNPLSTISSYAGFLTESGQQLPPPELVEFLGVIDHNATHLARVVDDLLLLARVRKQEVPLGPLDMAPLLDRVVARLSDIIADAQAEVVLPPANAWPVALGYAPWVEEIWANYLSNGCRYGGSPPRLELGSEAPASGQVRFWVRDHGPGIAAEDQARLFIPFTQLDHGLGDGHGLGLSIVRRIADKLGGQAGVESTPGRGSLFYFTLPAAPGPEPDQDTQGHAEETQRFTEKEGG